MALILSKLFESMESRMKIITRFHGRKREQWRRGRGGKHWPSWVCWSRNLVGRRWGPGIPTAKASSLCLPPSEPGVNSWCFRGKFQLRLQANLLFSIFKVLESMEQKWKIHYSCWDNWRKMQTPALEAKWDKAEFSFPGCGEDCEDHERTRRRSHYSCVQCAKNSNVSNLHFHTVIIIIIIIN